MAPSPTSSPKGKGHFSIKTNIEIPNLLHVIPITVAKKATTKRGYTPACALRMVRIARMQPGMPIIKPRQLMSPKTMPYIVGISQVF
jgi:hypothetical protein